jgi:DNA-binding transcriptional MocR family regulator
LVITPHGQNPFGASISDGRAAALRSVLDAHDVLVVEDGHGWDLETRPTTLTRGLRRWAVVRSMSPLVGSDVRTAFVAADMLNRLDAGQAVLAGNESVCALHPPSA